MLAMRSFKGILHVEYGGFWLEAHEGSGFSANSSSETLKVYTFSLQAEVPCGSGMTSSISGPT